MPSGCWISALLVLLLAAVTRAQSGDGDAIVEPRISCASHITTDGCSLTCKVVGGRNDNEDDEDDEADGIEKMTLCYDNWSAVKVECVEESGDTVSSRDLKPVVNVNVTVHLKTGGTITTTMDLKKIVKPRSPQVWNVTFNQESNQAVIYIRTPYHNDYLKVDNQLFQLLIWTAGSTMIQNISSLDMKIDMKHLLKNAEYHVKVRAIPQVFLQGSWSEWSETFGFFTPTDEKDQKLTEDSGETCALIVCLILLVVVPSSVVFFWKNKIFTYMWPSIPHPKHTLVQICKPNKGLLLNFKPEVFSVLKVYPMEETEQQLCGVTEPSTAAAAAAAAEGTLSNDPCSTQSSDSSRSTTSASTEELELSGLLSRSSSDGEDGLRSTSPSPIDILQLGERPPTPLPERSGGGNEAEVFGVGQQEEAYVTMSSFYQIK